MGASHLPWDLGSIIPEQPVPSFIRDMHRVRVLDWQFARAADFDTTNDWTATVTGTGATSRPAPSAAFSAPTLRIQEGASGDGYVAVHNSKFVSIPVAAQGLCFYVAFEFTLGATVTNCDSVFGLASGTPAQIFDPATKNVLTAGAGILIRRTASSGLWELFYKTATGALQTLGSTTLSMIANTFHRVGFIVLVDPDASASNNKALGRVIPFLQLLNTPGLAGGDDQSELPDAAFFMGKNGFNLDRTNANHTDGTATGMGIAIGIAGAAAGVRLQDFRRILYADNWRR